MDDEEKKLILEAIDETANELWDEFDTDKSGYLERDEFKNFCLKMSDALGIKAKKDSEETSWESLISNFII